MLYVGMVNNVSGYSVFVSLWEVVVFSNLETFQSVWLGYIFRKFSTMFPVEILLEDDQGDVYQLWCIPEDLPNERRHVGHIQLWKHCCLETFVWVIGIWRCSNRLFYASGLCGRIGALLLKRQWMCPNQISAFVIWLLCGELHHEEKRRLLKLDLLLVSVTW